MSTTTKAKRERSLPKPHRAEALFVTLDLDAEAIISFDNTHLMDYFLRHDFACPFSMSHSMFTVCRNTLRKL
ncbi:MAG: hypothetical protein ACYDBJ_08335 [Aggregatilineales bacterium]